MAAITREEFLNLKQYTLEQYEDSLGGQMLEYHVIVATDPSVNQTFGFGDPPTTVKNLLYSHKYFDTALGRRKVLSPTGDSFITDYDAVVYIPTADLERKGVQLQRDGAYVQLPDGAQYRIEDIMPLPRMHGTSLTHKLALTRRKPITDQPGQNL